MISDTVPPFPPQRIDVYYCLLPETPPNLGWKERSRDILDDHEFRRLLAFHRVRHQWIFAASHVLLRCVLAKRLNRGPDTLVFSTREHGKPVLNLPAEITPPAFNLTHTRSAVGIVVTDHGTVGVDMETIRERTSLDGLAHRTFSKSEWDTWLTMDTHQRCEHFFRIWTLKEACTKAEGRGVSHAFNTLSFDVSEASPRLVSGADCLSWKFWYFAQWYLTPDDILSVAFADHSRQSVHWELKRIDVSSVFESVGA